MTATTWQGFEWTKRGADGRTHEPIHFGSRPSLGENEPVKRLSERQRDAYLRAFDRHAKWARPSGMRRGARRRDGEGRPIPAPAGGARFHCISHAARAVLAYFLDLTVATGRVCPSYNHIAEVLDLPRSLVNRAVDQLEQFGWIRRERRFCEAPPPPPGETGPKLQQATNWYTVLIPDAAAALLGAWHRRRIKEAPPADPATVAARGRARGRERFRLQRRRLQQNLAQLQGFLAAASGRDRERLQRAVDEVAAEVAALLRREAQLTDTASERFVDAVAAGTQRESYGGVESSPFGLYLKQEGPPKRP